MRVRLLFVVSLVVGTLLSACDEGGGSGGGGNMSPGGHWVGITSEGEDVLGAIMFALVTETGSIHFRIGGRYGVGVLSVSNGNDVSGNFQFVTNPSGPSFPDGTTQSDCTVSGTVRERITMSITGDCTTTAGLQFQLTVPNLTYGPFIYERASSLATIAGMYDIGRAVMDIAADGTIFAQEAFTNCVINGQVNIIDPAFNFYDFQISYSSCTGPDADLNGATFVGIGYLLEITNPSPPDFSTVLGVTAIGEVNGVMVPRSIEGYRL